MTSSLWPVSHLSRIVLNPIEISTRRLGLPVQTEGGGDYSVIELPGIKHLGLWTLADAARSTFGIDEWPT